MLLDVAIAVALGGDCLADVAAVRAQRDRVWSRRRPLTGRPGTRDGGQAIIDIDATVVTAHSDKEGAQATHKMSYGLAPMCAFVDHGEHGTGETLALDLRPGKASPFNSADHITVLGAALDQLPAGERGQVLVRADAGGASKAFLHHLTDTGLQYSIKFPAHGPVQAAIETIPEQAWVAALDSDGTPREGAQVAELTAWMPTPVKPTRPPAKYGPQEWPHGMRVIARRERPHPGAQLRLTHHNGWPITCNAPAPKTVSAASKTPACITCPSTATGPTGSGSKSSPWPAI
ncbi:transposase [Mycobacterium palustre]|nr:transposase [Mycobacterium palustre]